MLGREEFVKSVLHDAHSLMDTAISHRFGLTGEEDFLPAMMMIVTNEDKPAMYCLPMDPVVSQGQAGNFGPLLSIRQLFQDWTDIQAVVYISEAWMSAQDAKQPLVKPRDDPDAQEVIYMVVDFRDGDQYTASAVIKNGNIGPKIQRKVGKGEQTSGRMANWFDPSFDKELDQWEREHIKRRSGELKQILLEHRKAQDENLKQQTNSEVPTTGTDSAGTPDVKA